MKKIGISFALTITSILLIPLFVTVLFGVPLDYSRPNIGTTAANSDYNYSDYDDYDDYDDVERVTVFNPQTTEKSDITLEQYIVGVVAAEMPASFHEEALKAQAVAARTYAKRRLNERTVVTKEDIDSIYQAYLSVNAMKDRWGQDFDANFDKIQKAVYDTKGEVLTYDGEPIEAVFHSMSAGVTEDAKNVWGKDYPYLQSVTSQEDILSSDFARDITFTNEDILAALRKNIDGVYLAEASFISQFQVIKRSSAGYILEAQLGNKIVTGAEIRRALGLRSAAFTVKEDGNNIVISTRGYGHGVGMSQEGANMMAGNGSGYREILARYYKGAEIK